MKQLVVVYGPPGVLVVQECPWWVVAIVEVACWVPQWWAWQHRTWQRIIEWSDARQRELVRIPIDDPGAVADALWPEVTE